MAESKLKVQRQHRGQAKRCLTILEKWLASLEDDYELESLTDGEIKLEDLKSWREKFEESHNGMTEYLIQLNTSDEDMENHEKDFEHFQERYTKAVSQLVSLIDVAKKALLAAQPVAADTAVKVLSKAQTSLKLPEIHLPVFDGKIINYESFKETFKALVHNDVRLSAVQKFFYLKGSLRDTSIFSEISSLSLTEENYTLAWELLVSRFENKKILVNKHIKHLFSLPKVERNSASSLRHLLDNVSKHIHGIKSQHISIPDVILIYVVTSKLDELTHQLWEAHDSNTNFDEVSSFESIKLFLLNRARALENVEEFSQRKLAEKPPAKNFAFSEKAKGFKQNPDKKRTFAAIQAENKSAKYENKSRYIATCNVCEETHKVWFCPKLLTQSVNERLVLIAEKQLCEKCLGKHNIKECISALTCKVCMKPHHHTLLHKDN